MADEIERKFLISNTSWKKIKPVAVYKVSQGYISSKGGKVVRVRIKQNEHGSTGYITIKGPSTGISRSEFEYEIPLPDAKKMLKELSEGAIIEKTRYLINNNGNIWELDVFGGKNKGLIVAELELKSVDEKFEIPTWIGAEVSHLRKYSNSNLVKTPYSEW